jgi:hypothetical protein
MLATGLASVAIIFWVAIYWILGPQFSYTAPCRWPSSCCWRATCCSTSCRTEFRLFPCQPALPVPVPALCRAVEQRHHFQQRRGDLGAAGPDRRHPVHRRSPVVGWFIAWVDPYRHLRPGRLVPCRSDDSRKSRSCRRAPPSSFSRSTSSPFSTIILRAAAPFHRHEPQDAQEPGSRPPADQDRTGALRKAAAQHPPRTRSPTG